LFGEPKHIKIEYHMRKISFLIGVFATIILTQSQFLHSQNALHFDGVNDRVSCGNNAAVQITSNQITLEAWIKPTAFGPNYWSNNIINKEVWSPESGYMLRCGAGGKLSFNLGNAGWHELTSTTNVLTTNTWYHVAGTYDGAKMRIYVNGILKDSVVANFGSIGNANTNLTIGDYAGAGRYFSGAIDEVRIWNVARTKAEILSTMNTEICGGMPGLKAYYRFNQGIASGSNSSITNLVDFSPNLSTGLLSNFALSGSTSNWVLGVNLSTNTSTTHDTIYDSFCQGSTYMFGNQSLTASGNYTHTFFSSNGCDSIVTLILAQNPISSSSFQDTICSGDTYSFGSLNLSTSGTYIQTFNSANGCDSNVTLQLYVKQVYTTIVMLSSVTMMINALNATYQWVDCDNNFTPIANETNPIFTPDHDGNYACIVTQNGCIDTSICVNIVGTSLNENDDTNDILIYPNPVEDVLTIKNNLQNVISVELMNLNGQVLNSYISSSQEILINMESLSKSVYYIRLLTDDKVRIYKIIKE
jgi:hypothetical protein